MAQSRIAVLRKKLDKLVKEQSKVLNELQKESAKLLPPRRKVRRFKRRVKKIVKR